MAEELKGLRFEILNMCYELNEAELMRVLDFMAGVNYMKKE